MRRSRLRTGLIAALALLVAGCQLDPDKADPGPAPEAAVAAFAASWSGLDPTSVAALTSDPGTAALQLAAVFSSLAPQHITVTPTSVKRTDDALATATAHYVWTLPSGISWGYDDTWQLRRSGNTGHPAADHWTVDWSATDIHPQLSDGETVAVRATAATSGRILDRTGAPIVAPVRVYSIVALPHQVGDVAKASAALAAILSPIDPTVTAAAVTAGLANATGVTGYTITNLRENDYLRVKAQLDALPGLVEPSALRSLPPTAGFAKVVLDQAMPTVTKLATGQPGWRIVSVDAAGDELDTLAQKAAVTGADVTLTLDTVTQQAAESVVGTMAKPTMIVAVQASTGEIMAVAQNPAANALGPVALTGLYPPGSTFKIVTASAGIDAGLITPSSPIGCPGSTVLGGLRVNNYEKFDLGQVSVMTAFARSCNTTFGTVASELPADALPEAALRYGIGLDFTIPGLTTLTGQVSSAQLVSQRAANGFGQGTVLVTPFAEAMMAATVAHGSLPTPTLIRGQTTTISPTPPPRSTATVSGLRDMMRAVVLGGTGTALQGVPDTYLKTGSAEYVLPDGSRHAHAWSVGYTGDLAYVVMTVGGDNSSLTSRLALAFVTQALPR